MFYGDNGSDVCGAYKVFDEMPQRNSVSEYVFLCVNLWICKLLSYEYTFLFTKLWTNIWNVEWSYEFWFFLSIYDFWRKDVGKIW